MRALHERPIGLCHDIRRALARVSAKSVCEFVSGRLGYLFLHAADCHLNKDLHGSVAYGPNRNKEMRLIQRATPTQRSYQQPRTSNSGKRTELA